jgi:hypothetical protein
MPAGAIKAVKDISDSAGGIGGALNAANDIFSIGKAVLTTGGVIAGVVWVIKKLSGYMTEHHSNVTKHHSTREEALDKKEDSLFSNTKHERDQNFELLRDMLKESANQTLVIKANAENSAKLICIVEKHSELLQENTNFITRLAEAIRLGNNDMLHKIHNAAENAFERYVDMLQSKPDIARRILEGRNNPVSAVMNEAANSLTDENGHPPTGHPSLDYFGTDAPRPGAAPVEPLPESAPDTRPKTA